MNVTRSIRKVAPSLSDADLVLAARTGETWARETLFQRHSEAAHRLAFVLLGPHGGSRNVLETAFADCFHHLGSLRDPSNFSRFIARQVVRIVRQRLRQARLPWRRQRPDFLGFRSQQALVHNEGDRIALTRFYECVEELAVDERIALLLRDVEHMDARDVAIALRSSAARARRWLLSAERQLRPLGAAGRVPHVLVAGTEVLPIPLSEFERVQLHRRIEQLLDAREERRYWPWAVGGAAVFLALVGALVLALRRPVAAAEPPPAPVVLMPAAAPQSVELPDGSRAQLSPAAQLRVNLADSEDIRLTLVSGRADFELNAMVGKRFVVNVGDATVAALGRRLSVSIEGEDPETHELTVEVSAGDGPAELWRRSDTPSILLGSEETWSGRVPQPLSP
ncbi:MAG: FecR domain-containing protein [Myxococcota bacterium]